MIAPAESIYDGTWRGEHMPAEVRDYELCREMGWSWRDLQETPVYVVRAFWDIACIRRENANRRNS